MLRSLCLLILVLPFTSLQAAQDNGCERWLLPKPRVAQSADYNENTGLHIAMIGDSTVRDFYLSSALSSFWQLWTKNQNNAFLSTVPKNGIESVYQKVSRLGAVKATEHSRAGARVETRLGFFTRFKLRLLNIKPLDAQVAEALRSKRLADLILLWMGNNNMDFAAQSNTSTTELRRRFVESYRHSLLALIARARLKPEKTAIVVYGMINAAATTKARADARFAQSRDATLYPYLKKGDQRFPSMRAEHVDELVRLSQEMSADLERLVFELQHETAAHPQVLLTYSDATQRADLSDPRLYHHVDAWHLSVAGKNAIADALYQGAHSGLDFLGFKP